MRDGVYFDYTALYRSENGTGYYSATGADQSEFKVNVCGVVNDNGPCQLKGAAICQITDDGAVVVPGSYTNTPRPEYDPIDENDVEQGLLLQFNNEPEGDLPCGSGVKRTSTLYLECDPNATEVRLEVTEPVVCVYEVVLTSNWSCPVDAPPTTTEWIKPTPSPSPSPVIPTTTTAGVVTSTALPSPSPAATTMLPTGTSTTSAMSTTGDMTTTGDVMTTTGDVMTTTGDMSTTTSGMSTTTHTSPSPSPSPATGDWGPWSDCSVTCGNGTETRECMSSNCTGTDVRFCQTGVECGSGSGKTKSPAGAAVGVTIGVLVACAVGYWLYKRKQENDNTVPIDDFVDEAAPGGAYANLVN